MEGGFRNSVAFGERIESFMLLLFRCPLKVAVWGYGLFIVVFGIWGLFNMFEDFGLWPIFEYFFTGIVSLLVFFGFWYLLMIGVVYWFVTEWNWEVWQAFLFIFPFIPVAIILPIWLIGTGLAAFSSLLGSLFGHKKRGDNGINC